MCLAARTCDGQVTGLAPFGAGVTFAKFIHDIDSILVRPGLFRGQHRPSGTSLICKVCDFTLVHTITITHISNKVGPIVQGV